MALDVGDRRIGVALSDPTGILATPYTIITCTEIGPDIDAVLEIVAAQDVARIIVGLPLSMAGSLGHQAEKVKAFTDQLSARTDVPIEFRDERLTTVAAKRLKPPRTGKRRRGKERYDDAAAAVLLQAFLEEGR